MVDDLKAPTGASQGLTMWRSCDGNPVPVLVKVDQQGWPHKDADGRVQYENTHFFTEAEAWEHGQASVDAAVSLSVRSVEHFRGQLLAAERRLADDVLAKHAFEAARREAQP